MSQSAELLFPNNSSTLRVEVEGSDSEWIGLFKENKSVALEQLYTKYAGLLFGVINRIVKNQDEAEQCLTEAFLKISINIHQYDSSTIRLFTWMMQIARSVAIDKLSNMKFESVKKTISPDNSEAIHFHSGANHTALKLIEPSPKLIFDLIIFKGYNPREIALNFQLSPENVNVGLRAAVKDLRNGGKYH